MTGRRPVLTLKHKPSPDDMAELLDQPASGTDQFHSHLLVKPSADFDGDLARLLDMLRAFGEQARGRRLSAKEADAFANAASGLIVRLKNRASLDMPAVGGQKKWSMG
jgi:hypothetical protein